MSPAMTEMGAPVSHWDESSNALASPGKQECIPSKAPLVTARRNILITRLLYHPGPGTQFLSGHDSQTTQPSTAVWEPTRASTGLKRAEAMLMENASSQTMEKASRVFVLR